MKMFFYVLYGYIEKHALAIALTITIILSVIAEEYSFQHGIITLYNDSTAHLDIARRVTDSLVPGFVQFGAVWLPLVHILEAPFTANYFLWSTGLAGSIVSMTCFFFASFAVFEIVCLLTKDRVAGLIASIAFITNANMLYMQTTPMFESVLITTLLWGIYFLLQWERNQSVTSLMAAAVFVMLTTMSRYDGWFLFFISIAVVFGISYYRNGYKRAEGRTLLYTVLAGIGVFLWFIYNKIIFGSFTYFLSGPFSSRGQQVLQQKAGLLPTYHNILLSLIVFSDSVLVNIGWIMFALLILATLYVTIHPRMPLGYKLGVLLLWTPFLFNVISLYLGQSVIWIHGVPPYTAEQFNVRYGLFMLPAAVVLVALLGAKIKYTKGVILVLVLIQVVFFYYNVHYHRFEINQIDTLQDKKSLLLPSTIQIAEWMSGNCNGGKLTLISGHAHEPVMFYSGIEEKYIISEGSGKYWDESMKKPSKYASCVIMQSWELDRVSVELQNRADLEQNFTLAEKVGSVRLYKRNF